ncbi:MAG: HAD family hydrolase [Proteobacteria bacterium]|nr:HAD family hydrolase [Pseudomonadota bacterium]
MAKRKIEAITFDLWDTVFIDDSDEPKRSARNLHPKPIERRNLVESFLSKGEPIAGEMVDVAYDTVDAAFRQVWYGQNITWTVSERLSVLLTGLGRTLPQDEFDELVRLHEEMELVVRPDLAPKIADALAGLSERYRLGVISDTIFSPGRVLKEILKGYDLLKYFDAFVFSDEIGYAKPTPIVFETIADELGVELAEIVHIGDREEKDVDGPHAVGAQAVFTSVVKDRGSADTKAEALCTEYGQLVEIVDKLNAT